jgi:ATP-binding protein involved in chromosome partitioning
MFRRRKESANGVTEREVLQALRTVMDPDLQRDIVSLGFVKNLAIEDGRVRFDMELTTPACPMQGKLKAAALEAVGRLPGVTQVEVNLTAQVRHGPASQPRPPVLEGIRHAVAVASGKGGVGKSTVAVNLALALAQAGAKVSLMDADVYGPSIPIMMGAYERPRQTADGKLFPLEKHGLQLLSMGNLAGEGTPIIWRGPLVGKLIQEFLGGVVWGERDYLVIDLPPGTGDAQLTLAQTAPLTGAVIVTTPQAVALEDVVRAVRMFQQVQVPILGVIENMSYFLCPHCGGRTDIFSHGGGKKAAEELQVPFLGEIPLDPQVVGGSDAGRPILLSHPDSPVSQAFRDIAGAMAARLSTLSLQG